MRSRVLVAAIAAVIGAGGIAAAMPAVAQTTNTSSSLPSGSTELRQLQQQISALQAKVDQLQQQQHQPAQTAAAPAAAQADRRLDALEQLVDNTKIGGTMYTDFTNIDKTSNGSKTAASGTGLDVKRFYLSIGHKFNDVWSANLTTDFNYTGVTGETQLFVKKAYLQGAFGKLATLRVGSANMPWIPFVEDWYGYRFVENTLTDRLHFANSADWGLHTLGDNGTFDYQVSMVNGGGYKHPARSNSVDFAGRVGIEPIRGLVFTVGGYSGDLGKDTATSPVLRGAHRYDAMAAWNRDGLRLGVEWFKADSWNNVTTPLADSADGYSLWGSYDFSTASVFARYDRVKPSKDLDPNLKDTYYNVGVAFPITKGMRVAIAWKNERLRNGTSVDVKSREIGAWGEVKF
ncbi:MAG: carbohydrate porin [Rhodanobacteraceae bacterium]|nr:MAG: carbohydrate porin [Rhodanobacteraceae bacterium]